MSPNHSLLRRAEAVRLGGAQDKQSFTCKPALELGLELGREPQAGTEALLPSRCKAELSSPCCALTQAVSLCLATVLGPRCPSHAV